MNAGSETFLLKVAVFGGLAVGAFLALRVVAQKAAAVLPGSAQAIADAVNPTKDTNLAYQAANAVTKAITSDDRPLGVQLWEWMNPGTVTKENAITMTTGGTTPDPSLYANDVYGSEAYFGPWQETPGGAVTGRTINLRRR
jgi:hypothetical protein